jgi:hypothetical protein
VSLPKAWRWNGACQQRPQADAAEHEEEIMAESGTKKVRDEKRQVRDLSMKPKADAGVQGGKVSPLIKHAIKGKTFSRVII